MIRLLIVEDSSLMRDVLSKVFEDDGGFEVRLARDGLEGVEENISFQPDVVTLDINMPKMDGIAALSRIMDERPVPVVMVSSMTEEGAFATLEALNLGAVDFISKPGGRNSKGLEEMCEELVFKVRNAHGARLRGNLVRGSADPAQMESRMPARPEPIQGETSNEGIVLIGASTGGPSTIEEILKCLPADLRWPIVVAQHMPPLITKSFAERLNQRCALKVVEVVSPMVLEGGVVYLAKGGGDIVFTLLGGSLSVIPTHEGQHYSAHPSVELLGRSILEHCDPSCVIGVMLTGIGSDGADAFTAIKNAGGRTIAESESSAVVFDMPSELINRRGATKVLPMEGIATQIVEWVYN